MGALKLTYYETKNPLKVVYSKSFEERKSVQRFLTNDILSHEYYGISQYAYVLNRPTIAIDPDGKRVYFIGGAANDSDGWNYINRWGNAFAKVGIEFYRVNATQGQKNDIQFTSNFRNSGYKEKTKSPDVNNFVGGLSPSFFEYTGELVPVQNDMITATVNSLKNHLEKNPLKKDEQFNLAGYSYGSVLQAQAALQLADGGQTIDNLVLIGSPISDKSDLMRQLKSNKNIKNVIRYDIQGDLLSNPQDVKDFIFGAVQNRKDSGPHFDAARPGSEADKLINTIVEWLKQQGVKN